MLPLADWDLARDVHMAETGIVGLTHPRSGLDHGDAMRTLEFGVFPYGTDPQRDVK